MKLHSKPLPVLAVAAVLGLVLGSIGTAVAAPAITKAKVKAIATKVVRKQAPGLAVATATNAGNAARLDGQPAASYLSSGYRFRLPATPADRITSWNFDVVPGTYEVTYAVISEVSTPGQGVSCSVFAAPATGGSNTEGRTFGTPRGPAGTFSTSTGGAILQVTTTATLECFTDAGTFTVLPGANTLSSVSFVKIDTLVNGTATTAPRPAATDTGGTSHSS